MKSTQTHFSSGMWQGILGHDEVVEQFRRTLALGRLASTYLFVGPPGIGKKRFAQEVAHSLLCTVSPDEALAPCGRCESCRLFAAGNHPDLDIVGIRPDKTELIIGQFIGDEKIPREDTVCHRLALKPFFGGKRVAIIDDADYFNVNSANCLLKTLEEPPPDSLLILIGTSPSRQLPTIRSRSQLVRFKPLNADDLERLILERGLVEESTAARRLAAEAQGSMENAAQMADRDLWSFRDRLNELLSSQHLDSVRAGRMIAEFSESAGKESSARRERLRAVVRIAVDYYRARLRDGKLEAAEQLDHCLAALEHIDRNVNQATLIHWLMCGLAHRRVPAR